LTRIAGTLVLVGPKTARRRRSLPLSRRIHEGLPAHRDRKVFVRAVAGGYWQERDFVFASTIGTPLQLRNILVS